jgi:hypothetical protein
VKSDGDDKKRSEKKKISQYSRDKIELKIKIRIRVEIRISIRPTGVVIRLPSTAKISLKKRRKNLHAEEKRKQKLSTLNIKLSFVNTGKLFPPSFETTVMMHICVISGIFFIQKLNKPK